MRLAVLAVSMLVFCASPCLGEPSGSPVASVIAIDGQLSVKSSGATGWSAGKVNMTEYAHDRLKTGEKSMAALEFTVGGKIGLSASTEVEIVGPRKAVDAASGTQITLNSGSIWAQMSPQKKPFEIKTRSCTIGIRGTEFSVEEKDDETEVSVISGEVGVTDSTNQVTIARPGHVLRIRPGQRPVVKLLQLAALRRMMQQRHGRLLLLLMARRQNASPTPGDRPQRRRRPFRTPAPGTTPRAEPSSAEPEN